MSEVKDSDSAFQHSFSCIRNMWLPFSVLRTSKSWKDSSDMWDRVWREGQIVKAELSYKEQLKRNKLEVRD